MFVSTLLAFVCLTLDDTFSLSSKGQIGNKEKKEKILIEEIIHGLFSPRGYNGTWISDNELMYRDFYGNLVVLDLNKTLPLDERISLAHTDTNNEPKLLVANTTFQVHYVQKYSLSPDRQYLMLVYDIKKIFRHTYMAQHRIYKIATE